MQGMGDAVAGVNQPYLVLNILGHLTNVCTSLSSASSLDTLPRAQGAISTSEPAETLSQHRGGGALAPTVRQAISCARPRGTQGRGMESGWRRVGGVAWWSHGHHPVAAGGCSQDPGQGRVSRVTLRPFPQGMRHCVRNSAHLY